MRAAVLGAAAAATLLGGVLAVTPLSTVESPAKDAVACSGASCERLASVLQPQAGPPATAPVAAAPVAPPLAAPPAPPAPAPAPPAPAPMPFLQPAAARVIAPTLAGPQPAAPGAAVPGTPAQPGAVIPGTNIPIPPELQNQAYAIVNSVVAAESAQVASPIISGVVGGASGLVGAVGSLGASAVTLVVLLNELNNGAGGGLTTANLVAMLIPGAGVIEQLDPALVAQLNTVDLAQLLRSVDVAKLNPADLTKLTSVPAIQAALRNLPPPNLAALPSPEQVLAVLHSLPPPQLPPLPPPPVICGPWIGFWQPCI